MSINGEHPRDSVQRQVHGEASPHESDQRGGEHHGGQQHGGGGEQGDQMKGMYLRFAAMILTAMVVMYWVMFVSSWEWEHVRFSQSRIFMALTMGGTMGFIMLGWMLNMYKSAKANVAIVAASALLLVGGVVLDRAQATVDDTAFMRGMIPHHSLAITRSERSSLSDVRVCELAVEIIKAQQREIAEMDWLIEDIERNGIATTAAEAEARPVPDFEGSSVRSCPAG